MTDDVGQTQRRVGSSSGKKGSGEKKRQVSTQRISKVRTG